LSRAQRRADSTGAPPNARAGIALARADLALELNTLAEAQRLYARAEGLYRLAAEPAGEAEAQEGRAVLLLERDDALHAQPLLETALRTQLGAGSVRAAALTRVTLGRAVLARGDTAAARGQLTRAAGEQDRGSDPVAAAAALGEWAALEARARITAPLDTAQDLVTREQDLRRRIGELTHDLAQSDATDETLRGSEVAVNAGTTRESLLRAQETYADLLLEARERAPRHATLVAPDVATWQGVARGLRPDAAFIEYLVS